MQPELTCKNKQDHVKLLLIMSPLSLCFWHSVWHLKCCFNSGLLMTPCKPIKNRSNLLSSSPLTITVPIQNLIDEITDWPTDSMTVCLSYVDCPLWRLCDHVVDRFLYVTVISSGSDWLSVLSVISFQPSPLPSWLFWICNQLGFLVVTLILRWKNIMALWKGWSWMRI